MKKIIIGTFFVLLIIIVLVMGFRINFKKSVSTVQEKNFNISKISIYSGASGENVSENYQKPEWNLNIYQYADIAIYLNRIKEFDNTNCIKRVYIDNINLGNPKLGDTKLYYLNPIEFGANTINETNEIVDKLEFNVLNSENLENDISYSIPILFQDLSNPITLKYVNRNIVSSYKISNENKIIFDGSLLKMAQVNPKSIENKIEFFINIKTQDDKLISQKIEIDIPLKNSENMSIYEGNIKLDYVLNIAF